MTATRATKRLHNSKSTRIWDENAGYDSPAHERLMHKKQNEAFVIAMEAANNDAQNDKCSTMEATNVVVQKCKCPRCGLVNQFCTEGRKYRISPFANTMTCVGKACEYASDAP